MTAFIIVCIVAGVLIIASLVLWVLSFTPKIQENDSQIAYRAFGTTCAIVAALTATVFMNSYSRCPDCDYMTNADFCPECAAEVNPSVACPGCEKEFNIDNVPAFCPDCGTKVKE